MNTEVNFNKCKSYSSDKYIIFLHIYVKVLADIHQKLPIYI